MPLVTSTTATGAGIALGVTLAAATAVLTHRCSRLSRHLRRHRDAVARLRHARQDSKLSAVERYLAQVRTAPAPALVTSPAGAVIAASPALLLLFGYGTEQELKAVPVTDLYRNAADRAQLTAMLHKQGLVRSGELHLRRRDGAEFLALATVRIVSPDHRTTYYETVLTDITELREAFERRRQLEAQLHLARKLELIGQLASGIAHEINTPMQFIGDNIVFLQRAFDRLASQLPHRGEAPGTQAAAPSASPKQLSNLLSEVADAFAGSLEGVAQVSETVRAMKEFAHPGDLELSSTDINHALKTAMVVARNEYKNIADIKLELGDIPPIDCRRAEINKVFLNLIVNAAHAIQETGGSRGTITIRTTVDGVHVRIEISDTGCGIAPAVLPLIFDPFFTTKAVGKGTGQGLAIARTIVKNHGGDLDVTSTVGRGATFSIMLPIGSGATAAEKSKVSKVDLTTLIG